MIKPPFTIIVLKDSYNPVTLRITKRLVLLIFLVLCVVSVLAFRGVISLYPREVSELPAENMDRAADESGYILAENTEDGDIAADDLNKPDVAGMSINEINDNEIEFEFSFMRISNSQNLYVWIIINPEAETAGEMIIHPRSPMFRGLPVDFRNGIHYNGAEYSSVNAVFQDLKIGLDFTSFRVLAYSEDGGIILDRLFNIHKNIRL